MSTKNTTPGGQIIAAHTPGARQAEHAPGCPAARQESFTRPIGDELDGPVMTIHRCLDCGAQATLNPDGEIQAPTTASGALVGSRPANGEDADLMRPTGKGTR